MGKRTPLYDAHLRMGAKMVDFAGYDMPINYGSQLAEHRAVRAEAGMFDVSHMCVVDLRGARTREFLRHLLANDVARLDGKPGKAIYSCMLNPEGGVIDDLIVYHMSPEWYRMVVNAATREKDLAWIRQHGAAFGVEIQPRDDLAMIAVQGPDARDTVHRLLGEGAVAALQRFSACEAGSWFVARTGYTGEDGYEIMLPAQEADAFWSALHAAGVAPCGLGARDTLRLEAGMNLYGQDMDEQSSPLISGLAWTVAWEPAERQFVGREALERERSNPPARLVGLVLEEKGMLRPHQRVLVDGAEGEITSGSFSPTLNRAIAFARLPAGEAETALVDVRGKQLKARIVAPPFVRDGRARVSV